jgi:hypothetical protein
MISTNRRFADSIQAAKWICTAVLLGCGAIPAVAQTSASPLGSSTFFAQAKARLVQSKTKSLYFDHSWVSVDGITAVTGLQGIILNASDFKLRTYVVPTSGIGTIIDDVAQSNPDAEVIINGAMCNYGVSNWGSSAPDAEPMKTIGNVVSDHSLISTNVSLGARRRALSRYWLGQDYGVADEGAGYSFHFSEYPIGSFFKGDPPLLDAALGGLTSLIMPVGHLQKSTGAPSERDTDLGIYEPLHLNTSTKSFSSGYFVGFNIVAVDRDTGLLIVLTRPNGVLNNAIPLLAAQDLLFRSGADLALLTDGGGSTACWVRGKGVVTRAWRQIRGKADDKNTVTNYLIFKPTD